jgi:hypothetical protein
LWVRKVVIFFKGAGNVPQMKLKKFKFATTTKFQGIIEWLRKQLHLNATEPLVRVIIHSP